jgi:hypothetical protein
MSAPEPMPSVRRRPIPGMTSLAVTPAPSAPAVPSPQPPDADGPAISPLAIEQRPVAPDQDENTGRDAPRPCRSDEAEQGRKRRPATDYSATRLANFRIPVTALDCYRQLVREAEGRDPRLRRPSVTEVVIGLLQEGPQTPDEVAELIRRKRADEHGFGGLT